MSNLYILDNHAPVKTDDINVWGRCFDDMDKRRVGYDEFGDIRISTVFLGMDHGFGGGAPILFETMIFAPDGDVLEEKMWRYQTWDEAAEGHRHAVRCVERLLRWRARTSGRPRTREEGG